MYTFAHVFNMRQVKVLNDNEWIGWLAWMKSAFEEGSIKEIWKSKIEVEKWFDPAFQSYQSQSYTNFSLPVEYTLSKSDRIDLIRYYNLISKIKEDLIKNALQWLNIYSKERDHI